MTQEIERLFNVFKAQFNNNGSNSRTASPSKTRKVD